MINMYNDESTMHVIERKKGLFAHFLRDVLQVCVHALYTFLYKKKYNYAFYSSIAP